MDQPAKRARAEAPDVDDAVADGDTNKGGKEGGEVDEDEDDDGVAAAADEDEDDDEAGGGVGKQSPGALLGVVLRPKTPIPLFPSPTEGN